MPHIQNHRVSFSEAGLHNVAWGDVGTWGDHRSPDMVDGSDGLSTDERWPTGNRSGSANHVLFVPRCSCSFTLILSILLTGWIGHGWLGLADWCRGRSARVSGCTWGGGGDGGDAYGEVS